MGKPKKLPYRLIERSSEEGRPVYEMLERYIERFHQHLDAHRVACAWAFSWKPNADGQVVLGKCKRASDLDRELIEFDFIILLNRDFWTRAEVTDDMREALVDHELCHAEEALDKDGAAKVDQRGRKVFRTRKHDIEEFNAVVLRHGVWKRDIQFFAAALAEADKKPLFAPDQKPKLEKAAAALAKAAKDPKSPLGKATANFRKVVSDAKKKGITMSVRVPGQPEVKL